MNPETDNQMVEPVVVAEPITKAPHPVNQVTVLSKTLAALIFIIMPFVGAYIGYQMAGESLVASESDSGSTVVQTKKTPERSAMVMSEYIHRIGANGYPSALVMSQISSSSVGKKTYFVNLPYEGYSYSQLLYSELWSSGDERSNGIGIYAVYPPLLMHSEQRSPFYSATTSAVYWLHSPNHKKLAVVSPDEKSPVFCSGQGMVNPLGVDDTLYIIDLDTAQAQFLKETLSDPFTSYQILDWSDENTLQVLKQTYEPVTTEEARIKYGTSCGDFGQQKLAGKILREEKVTISLVTDFDLGKYKAIYGPRN